MNRKQVKVLNPDNKNRRLIVPRGCKVFLYDIVKKDFVNEKEGLDEAFKNRIIPVVALNKQNAIKKVGQIILQLAYIQREMDRQGVKLEPEVKEPEVSNE